MLASYSSNCQKLRCVMIPTLENGICYTAERSENMYKLFGEQLEMCSENLKCTFPKTQVICLWNTIKRYSYMHMKKVQGRVFSTTTQVSIQRRMDKYISVFSNSEIHTTAMKIKESDSVWFMWINLKNLVLRTGNKRKLQNICIIQHIVGLP